MPRSHIFVGLEVGTTKICAAVGEERHDGRLRILGLGEAPSRAVRKGEIITLGTASKCVLEALVDAEKKCDVQIDTVYLAVTGSHLESFNNRAAIDLPDDRKEILESDLEELQAAAGEVVIPQQNDYLHSILQGYYVDGNDGVKDPVGMVGHRLEADYHIIHAAASRIQNSVRCVEVSEIKVEEVVFGGLASAVAVLDNEQKRLGTLVIDIGGGTTDYLIYHDGAIRHSGVLAVGGDHITNDISLGLRLPTGHAERLKVEEGSAIVGNCLPGETITLKDEAGFAGREVPRETLNSIIYMRMRETFELLKARVDQDPHPPLLAGGVVLTGGTSRLHGIDHLAREIFERPARTASAQPLEGVIDAFRDPKYATAIGLVVYAQALEAEFGTPTWLGRMSDAMRSFIGRFANKGRRQP